MKANSIESIDKNICCGCSLCSLNCPVSAIDMQPDAEGFIFPKVNQDVCLDCGLCLKQCTVTSHTKYENPTYYAAIIKDNVKLKKSSSGGLFYELARAIVNQGGYVCGCVFDDQMKAIHICSDKETDIVRMMGSKYVQSDVADCLAEVKKKIESGIKVLFTGTACQVEAAKRITKNSSLLYAVDILCHGVPSPLFFRKYVEHIEDKHNGTLLKIEFRNKDKLGWGAEHRTFYEIQTQSKVISCRPLIPAYFCAFFWGSNLRESCYKCQYAGASRNSDMTIGDFWGAGVYYRRNFSDGISICSVNTEKGRELIDFVKGSCSFFDEVPMAPARGTNTNLYHPTIRPKSRTDFYSGIETKKYKDFIFKVYFDKYCRKKMLTTLYGKFAPDLIKKIYGKIKRGI